MRKFLIAGIVAGQIVAAAQPAMAAELHQDRVAAPNQVSAFAGARLRVPLGGGGGEKARAGLALTSTLRSDATGELRFTRGAELGFSKDEPVRFTLAGTPLWRLAQGRAGPEGRKLGVSTIGWVAIGVGALAVTYFALFSLCRDGEICGDDGDG